MATAAAEFAQLKLERIGRFGQNPSLRTLNQLA
jgi:hypothetical protein